MICKIPLRKTSVLSCVLVLTSLSLALADARYSRRIAQTKQEEGEAISDNAELDRLLWTYGGLQPCKTSYACPATEPYCLRGNGKIKGLCVECLSDSACPDYQTCDRSSYKCRNTQVTYVSALGTNKISLYSCLSNFQDCQKQVDLGAGGIFSAFLAINGPTLLAASAQERQVVGCRIDGRNLLDCSPNKLDFVPGLGSFGSPSVVFYPTFFLSSFNNDPVYACDVNAQTVSNCVDSGFAIPANARASNSQLLSTVSSVNVYEGYAYLIVGFGDYNKYTVSVISCQISGKKLQNCKDAGLPSGYQPVTLAFYQSGTESYTVFGDTVSNTYFSCKVQNGLLSSCSNTTATVPSQPLLTTVDQTKMYSLYFKGINTTLISCDISGSQTLANCQNEYPLPAGEQSIYVA